MNGGDIEVEILKVQCINSVQSLLRSTDLFSIFQLDCDELHELRTRVCWKLNDGTYLVKPVIRDNLRYCVSILKDIFNPMERKKENASFPGLPDQSLLLDADSFAHEFIDNMMKNMHQSKNNYLYSPLVRRFASTLYVLGRRNTYEFLRINLPGSLPALTTLQIYNDEFCKPVEEGEFRFNELKHHLDKGDCAFVFLSEDSTGAISRIQNDVNADSFIGFCPKFTNGIPTIRQYKFDRFEQLEECFQMIEKSTLVHVHMVQPISSVPLWPFLLSGFGTL